MGKQPKKDTEEGNILRSFLRGQSLFGGSFINYMQSGADYYFTVY